MDKYGVKEKQSEKVRCPNCNSLLEKHGKVLLCPKCGSEPFEEKDPEKSFKESDEEK